METYLIAIRSRTRNRNLLLFKKWGNVIRELLFDGTWLTVLCVKIKGQLPSFSFEADWKHEERVLQMISVSPNNLFWNYFLQYDWISPAYFDSWLIWNQRKSPTLLSIHVIPERSLTLDNQLILLALRVLHCHPWVHSYLKKTSLRNEMCSITDQMWSLILLLLYYEWYL